MYDSTERTDVWLECLRKEWEWQAPTRSELTRGLGASADSRSSKCPTGSPEVVSAQLRSRHLQWLLAAEDDKYDEISATDRLVNSSFCQTGVACAARGNGLTRACASPEAKLIGLRPSRVGRRMQRPCFVKQGRSYQEFQSGSLNILLTLCTTVRLVTRA